MDKLVSTDWLAGELGATDLVVLDATLHLPEAGRDAPAEFLAGHIPGARFLDLESFVDTGSPVPKALPTAAQFAQRLGLLGVAPDMRVVLYDDSQVKSSARAWFVFDEFGFGKVAILDGGLTKWRAEGRPLDGTIPQITPVVFPEPEPRRSVRSKADILANCADRTEQVVDARDAARFAGAEGSGSAGHIPGSANLHFPRMFGADGTWKTPTAIREEFAAQGIDLAQSVVTSCNSGVTACVLLFGLRLAGKDDVALYDGSWMEWGGDPTTPKERGSAR